MGPKLNVGWEHATPVRGNKLRCNYCEETIPGGYTKMYQHIARIKGDVEPCTQAPEKVSRTLKTHLSKKMKETKGKTTAKTKKEALLKASPNESLSVKEGDIGGMASSSGQKCASCPNCLSRNFSAKEGTNIHVNVVNVPMLTSKEMSTQSGKIDFGALKARREHITVAESSKSAIGDKRRKCPPEKDKGKNKVEGSKQNSLIIWKGNGKEGGPSGENRNRNERENKKIHDNQPSPRMNADPRRDAAKAREMNLEIPREGAVLPSRPKNVLSVYGVNRAEGAESYWDEDDVGLASSKSSSLLSKYDLTRLEKRDDCVIAESLMAGCVQIMHFGTILKNRVKEFKRLSSEYEMELHDRKEDDANLRDLVNTLKNEIQSVQDEKKELKEKLSHEISSGETFLSSEAGHEYISNLRQSVAKSAVKNFKESPEFDEMCMDRAMGVWDDVVKDCQKKLRESGRVSEDVVQLLGGAAPGVDALGVDHNDQLADDEMHDIN